MEFRMMRYVLFFFLFIILTMNRMYLKKRKQFKVKKINIIIIILLLIFMAVIYTLNIFNKKALPLFIEYSTIETKKIASLIITSTVTEKIANNTTLDDLFVTLKDSNGDIKSIDFKSSEVNKLLVQTSKLVEENLNNLETGNIDKLNISEKTLKGYNINKLKNGIIFEVPSGIILNNSIIYNIFPKIPVRLETIGNTVCRLNTNIESYGINNALIKISIDVIVDIKILLPFISKINTFTVNIPIIMKVIEGNIPSYYFNGYLNSPTIE